MNLILPSIMQSIKPFRCGNIAVGKKTIEVRKTRPKLKPPFKVYIYATRPKHFFSISAALRSATDYLYMLENGTVKCGDGFEDYDKRVKMLNGKVIGEYICDDIVELEYDEFEECYMFKNCYCGYTLDEILSASCLSYDAFCKYGNRKPIYLWHITNLKIYDEPKELSEFEIIDKKFLKECPYRIRVYNNPDYTNGALLKGSYVCNNSFEPDFCRGQCGGATKPLTRPPQSWCYCEEI